MTIENIKTYKEIPEDIKNDYKPINEKGDFADKTAIENKEVAERLAFLENEAFEALAESIEKNNISVNELLEKLADEKINYDEKRQLEELLLQHLDLQRMKEIPVDEQVKKTLEKLYITPNYSLMLTDKIVKNILPNETNVIGEILKDEKIRYSGGVTSKIPNDEERYKVFEICKTRIKSACDIIGLIENINLALSMYIETKKLADKDSYSDNNDLMYLGERLANKLYETNDKEKLLEMVKSDVLELSFYKDFLHNFGNEPQFLIDLINNSGNENGVRYAQKFIADPKFLEQLSSEKSLLKILDKDKRNNVIDHGKNIAEALNKPAEVIRLTELKPDEYDKYADKKMAENKFVVEIKKDKYVIAWSSMSRYKYHKDIFNAINHYSERNMVKSGGYIGMTEKDGKLEIRMERSSSDFGFYSKELLEKNRDILEKSLKEALGNQEFELIIKTSTQF